MGKNRLGDGLGWLAYGVLIVVSATVFYIQYTLPPWGYDIPASAQTAAAAQKARAASTAHAAPASHPAPTAQESVAPGAPTKAELVAASPPLADWAPQFELPPGLAPEQGLQVNTIWVARVISVLFPQLTTIGGYRQDPLPWHPNGLAIDVMIPNHNSPEGIELGNRIAGLVLANARLWGVIHVIWRQSFYPGVGAPSGMADLGNETANHYDHLHIATIGGGYPTGQETYYLGAMRRPPPR